VKKETKRNIIKGIKIVLAILTFPLHVLIMEAMVWAFFLKNLLEE
jgi:hypothetical protein